MKGFLLSYNCYNLWRYIMFSTVIYSAKLINSLLNQVNKPSPLVIINNKEEWEVKEIFNTKSHWGKVQYWVKCVGWDEDREWYDLAGFENSPKIIQDFHICYPKKPRSKIPIRQKSGKKKGVENWECCSTIRSRDFES